MKTVLFQGDSITDAQRIRTSETFAGSGYATMTAGKIAVDYPGKYRMLNRGISGNRSTDLYARIKSDVINLKPDIMTVLIGVNDVWHEINWQNGVSPEKYERILSMFVQEVKEALPETQIVFLEPFILDGSATSDNLDRFTEQVDLTAQACRRVAEAYGIPFVPLQQKMKELAALSSNEYVLYDGVHPTYAGHELISRELYAALQKIL